MPTFTEDSSMLNDVNPFIKSLGFTCHLNQHHTDYWLNLENGTLLEACEKMENDIETPINILGSRCRTALKTIGPYSPQSINDKLVNVLIRITESPGTSFLDLYRRAKKENLISKKLLNELKNRIKGKFPNAEVAEDWVE